MEVKTFTYEKLLGTYRLQSWFDSEKMDDHIAKMMSGGWKILSQNAIPGNGRTFGPGVVHDKMSITFGKG